MHHVGHSEVETPIKFPCVNKATIGFKPNFLKRVRAMGRKDSKAITGQPVTEGWRSCIDQTDKSHLSEAF